MRLGYLLQNNKTIVFGVIAAICALFLGYEAHSRWVISEGLATVPADALSYAQLLRLVSDLTALGALLFGCWTIGRVAWRLRRYIPFGSTGFVLVLMVAGVGLKRLLDIAAVRRSVDSSGPNYIVTASAISALVACGLVLLLPFLRKLANFGLSAGAEHEKFLALAENTGENLCLMESVYSPLHRIVDFRFAFVNGHAEKLLQLGYDNITSITNINEEDQKTLLDELKLPLGPKKVSFAMVIAFVCFGCHL